MKERHLNRTEAIDPAQIGANLWALVAPVLIGIAIGAVAILLLRRFRLRWTWALPSLPLAYLLATVGAWKAAWSLAWRAPPPPASAPTGTARTTTAAARTPA